MEHANKEQKDWEIVHQVKNKLESIFDDEISSEDDSNDEDEDEYEYRDEDGDEDRNEEEDESSEDSVHGWGKYASASIKRISAQDVKDDRDTEYDGHCGWNPHLSRSKHRFDLSYKKKFHLFMNI